jgi:hypothetical protein
VRGAIQPKIMREVLSLRERESFSYWVWSW